MQKRFHYHQTSYITITYLTLTKLENIFYMFILLYLINVIIVLVNNTLIATNEQSIETGDFASTYAVEQDITATVILPKGPHYQNEKYWFLLYQIQKIARSFNVCF
jgi:hypothetical protein